MMILTLLASALVLAAALGIYEAWSKKRGAMGWVVSIVASVVGGVFVGAALPQLIIMGLRPSENVVLWIGLASVVGGALVGSWAALWIVNRFR